MNRILIAGLVAWAVSLGGRVSVEAQVYSGHDQENRVRDLQHEIHWYKSITEAMGEAKKEHKMIFWVQMLGDMDGTT